MEFVPSARAARGNKSLLWKNVEQEVKLISLASEIIGLDYTSNFIVDYGIKFEILTTMEHCSCKLTNREWKIRIANRFMVEFYVHRRYLRLETKHASPNLYEI